MAKKKRDGFYKRGRFWWASSDPVTNKPATTKCTNIEAARAWFKERELLANDPTYARSKSATLGEWCDKYLALKSTNSKATQGHDASKIKAILGVLPRETALASIGSGTFDEYVITRRSQFNKQKGKAPGDYTIRRELNKLVGVLTLAKRGKCYQGELDALIPTGLEGHYTPRERSLSEYEITRLLSVLTRERWRAIVLVCIAVGCRLSEACKLSPDDIDLEAGLVYIRGTKTAKSNRELPIIGPYRKMLEAALPSLPIGKLHSIDRTFKLAAAKAQIEKFSPNDLRRTHSTLLGERGIHDDTIARLLGHTTVTLAKRTYNRARALELAPIVEAQLLQAKPIVISLDYEQISDGISRKGANNDDKHK